MKKSYWMGVTTHTDRQKQAVLSWLLPLCDGMTVESAQVLCDVATDREKKIKAVVVDAKGKRKLATRTLGGKTVSMSLSPLQQAGPMKSRDRASRNRDGTQLTIALKDREGG